MAKFVEKCEVASWALIGDLVGSRDLAGGERAALQDELRGALVELGSVDGAFLAAPAITGGDEFEALAAEPGPLIDVLLGVDDALQGRSSVRFGIGCGALSTPIGAADRPRVGELDGPCFHAARRAIDRTRELGSWLALEGPGGPLDPGLESLAELIGIERRSWTDKQAKTVTLARTHKQQDVARALAVAPSVISERLKATHFDALMRAEGALRAGLRWHADRADGPGPPPGRGDASADGRGAQERPR